MNAAGAGGNGEKMKVVVSEQRVGPVSEILHKPQSFKRFRAAVHNVAEKKKFGVFGDLLEQSF